MRGHEYRGREDNHNRHYVGFTVILGRSVYFLIWRLIAHGAPNRLKCSPHYKLALDQHNLWLELTASGLPLWHIVITFGQLLGLAATASVCGLIALILSANCFHPVIYVSIRRF